MYHKLAAVVGLTIATMAGDAVAQDSMGKTRGREGNAAKATSAKAEADARSMESFSIDGVHSMALFRVSHANAGMFWGRFNGVSGTIEHDPTAPDGLRMDVSIDIDSVDTGSEGLDNHLKSADFFAVEQHPTATFRSTSAERAGERMYKVSGELTMLGVTKPITVDVEWLQTSEGRRGKRSGFETTFRVQRSDFGMSYGVGGGIGDDTRIIVAMEAVAGGERRRGGGGGLGRFSGLDANEDGKLQKDEAPEGLKERFDELDTNNDGALDTEELRAMRGRRGEGRDRRAGSDDDDA